VKWRLHPRHTWPANRLARLLFGSVQAYEHLPYPHLFDLVTLEGWRVLRIWKSSLRYEEAAIGWLQMHRRRGS
jgi:hypothetical protein